MDLDATVGGTAANSYLTVDEANDYFSSRSTIDEWESAESQEALLMMATRTLNVVTQAHKRLIRGERPYYVTSATWTGAPATTTQALPWPRTGMYDANGNAIASNVIPQALKDATAELAGQLAKADRTLDNEVAVRGITALRAGSVSLSFKEMIESNVIPEAVWNLLVASWLTDEVLTQAWGAEFDVVSS